MTAYRPTVVYIEALWVVPPKFEVLTKLHPSVEWIVRMHSEVPFMANEGIAVEWCIDYVKYPKVRISGNSHRLNENLRTLIQTSYPHWSPEEVAYNVVYLPNCYDTNVEVASQKHPTPGETHIGCFGAIRPLKNQLIQAIAAIKYVEKYHPGEKLVFHMNGERIENARS